MPLTQCAAGRPFVWIDDEITDADRWLIAARHPQPTLLHRVGPYQGLTATDLAVVRQWLRQRDESG